MKNDSHRTRVHPPAGLAGWVAAACLLVTVIWSPAPRAAGFPVGYVDLDLCMKAHPRYAAVQQQVVAYRDQRNHELDSLRKPNLTDDEKRTIVMRTQEIMESVRLKESELLAPLAVEVEGAIDDVGAQSGVEVILEAAAVHWGGVDLTPAVKERLSNP